MDGKNQGVMSASLKLLVPLLLALGGAAPVAAQTGTSGMVLDSVVELEKRETAPDGTVTLRYTTPDVVIPGDRARITLNYHNRGRVPFTNLRLNNPIPAGLQFEGSESLTGFSLSVDGGTVWGQLADLKVKDADGSERAAQATDVTHVRWVFTEPVPVGGRGSVTFFTRVR